MKRDFSSPIVDLKGKPVLEGVSSDAISRALNKMPKDMAETFMKILQEEGMVPMTLGSVAADALIRGFEDEKNLILKKKTERTELALRIVKGGIVEITPDEREEIKTIVNKAYPGALVPARVATLMETDVEEEEPQPAKIASRE